MGDRYNLIDGDITHITQYIIENGTDTNIDADRFYNTGQKTFIKDANIFMFFNLGYYIPTDMLIEITPSVKYDDSTLNSYYITGTVVGIIKNTDTPIRQPENVCGPNTQLAEYNAPTYGYYVPKNKTIQITVKL